MTFNFSMTGLLVVIFFSINCVAAESVGNQEWKIRMQNMLSDVLTLFPYAFDDTKIIDPASASKLKMSMKSLAKHSSELKKHTAKFTQEDGLKIDPSFPFIAEAFEREIKSAEYAFRSENSFNPQAQNYLRAAISKCILCHTQSEIGPEIKLDQFKKHFATLSSSDKFLALAATRQFDEAMDEFAKTLRESKIVKTDQFKIDRDSKAALAIAVRVKKDPKRALSLINEIAESGSVSQTLLKDLKGWKKAVLAWQAETPMELNSDEELFSMAKGLIDSSRRKERSLDDYENASVSLLRASSYLHTLLSSYPNSLLRAKSYILLASTYDLLPGFNLWEIPDEYLGACIKENPHSEIGEKCFQDYKELVVLGYSGSSGIHIPTDVRKHLEKMKELAKQKTATTNKPRRIR